MEIMVEWLDDYHKGVKVKMYVIVGVLLSKCISATHLVVKELNVLGHWHLHFNA
jgi:hypothetical protein